MVGVGIGAIWLWTITASRICEALLAGLWHASVGGALIALPVWAICRFLPRLPAAARFWLWWLVCAKLLVGLAIALAPAKTAPLPSVTLRLPAHQAASAPAFFVARLAARPEQTLRRASRVTVRAVEHAGIASGIVRKAAPQTQAALPTGSLTPDTESATASAAASSDPDSGRLTIDVRTTGRRTILATALPVAAITLAAAWMVAAGFSAVRQLRGLRASRRLCRDALPVDGDTRDEATRVARRLGMGSRRAAAITVRFSRTIPAPLVTGLWTPVVVLPEPPTLSAEERSLALAHEIAHVVRRDLWLGTIPLLAETLFFFLPLARWAARECAACREEACDAAAIGATSPDRLAGYGRLLLKATLAAAGDGDRWRRAASSASAIGIVPGASRSGSPAFLLLRRRLTALQASGGRPLSAGWRRAGALLVAITLPGLLPLRLRAMHEIGSTVRDPAAPRAGQGAADAVAPSAASLPEYDVIDLGTLGGRYSEANAVSDDGAVVGAATVPPRSRRGRRVVSGNGHAFLRLPGASEQQDLGGGSTFRHSMAAAINGSGEIAAIAFNDPRKPSAFVWSPDGSGRRRYLAALPGYRYSRALAIDDRGIVAGAAQRPARDADGAVPMRACVWPGSSAGVAGSAQTRDLGTLGGRYSVALAATTGHVAGKADTADGATHAFLWRADHPGLQDLGVLPGGRNSAATTLNRNGDVAGYSETAVAPRRAFLFAQGHMEELASFVGIDDARTSTSVAYGMNDAGFVVGAASFTPNADEATLSHAEPRSRAVAWIPVDGTSQHVGVDLNSRLLAGSPWNLETARGVNNLGEIVGVGTVRGYRHAFLLVPRTGARFRVRATW